MTVISPQASKLLALAMLKGVGPVALRKVAQVQHFGEMSIEELRPHLPRQALANVGLSEIAEASSEASRQIESAASVGARIISSVDPDYPQLLKETREDPQILFVRGKFAKNAEKAVAIIGTREPTEHGKIIAERLTKFFVTEGWSIVSGLALGCDAIAHQTAIDAGGHTVAVLAHGLQTMAPSRHKKLAERILETGGALVTEYRFGQAPLPQQFVKRDRIQAGLARGVVMIQSDLIGGSLHASRASIDYKRWLAVPYPTEQDITNREPKIQANLLLAEGSPASIADLLRCPQNDLRGLIILRSKADYASMLAPSSPVTVPARPPIQGQLF